MTVPDFNELLRAAADQYAEAKVAGATAQYQEQLVAAQAQLAALQTQLANALAVDAADKATVGQLQATVANLQAQLAALTPGKAPAPPAGWAVAFQDDCDTPSLDGGCWSATTDAAGNELSQRLPANVLPSTDHLTIRARRQDYGGRQFTSGYITTAGRFSVPFGRWLVRARWDDLYGLWPALWLRDDTGLGEIDIMESVGTVPKLVQTVHQSTNGDQDRSGNEWPMPAGWAPSDWHVYGLQRDHTGTLTWTVDGRPVFTRSTSDTGSRSKAPMTWLTGPAFPSKLHLIINLQVGGSMPAYYLGKGYDPAKILPGDTVGTLDIDWVQVLTPLAG
ncbi:MAG TPA: glycoside hydrolase family 16 protein [Jatrophihabitans sp.]|nr:glycoside hydrolase family 16 protein [Jatrophihabitans sp.]